MRRVSLKIFLLILVIKNSAPAKFTLVNSEHESSESTSFDYLEDLCNYNITDCCHFLDIKITHTNVEDNSTCPDEFWTNANTIKSVRIFGGPLDSNIWSFLKNLTVSEFEADNLQAGDILYFTTFGEALFLPYLMKLRITSTSLGNLTKYEDIFRHMFSLSSLKLSNVNISELDFNIFSNNEKLSELDLSRNDLKKMTFPEEFLKNLTFLNMSDCNLSSIDVIASKNKNHFHKTKLQNVDLSKNNLQFLPELFCNSLAPEAQAYLTDNDWDMDNCNFYHLWKFLFINDNADIGFEERKPNLLSCRWDVCPLYCRCYPENKTVDCSNSGLSLIPDVGPSDAETLILSKNSVADDVGLWLQRSVSWCKLKKLYLDYNNISYILVENQREIYGYGSCPCPDKVASNCILPDLKHISLSGNQITGFSAMDWNYIRRFDAVNLSRNRIQQISLNDGTLHQDFSTISFLDLSFNLQTSFGWRDALLFPYLRSLNLSHNNLSQFDFRVSSIMPQLVSLDLSFNRMKRMVLPQPQEDDPYSTFVPHLENLYLHKNDLHEMISPIWRSLVTLTIHGNSWNCSRGNVQNMKEVLWKNLRTNVAQTVLRWECYEAEIQEDANSSPANEDDLFIVIACTVLFFVLLIFFAVPIKNNIRYLFYYIGRTGHVDLSEREYDVSILHADDTKDKDYVMREVIPRLKDANYKVAYPEQIRAGDYFAATRINMITKSRRMVVVISKNFISSKDNLWDLNQGLCEERFTGNEFKVCAFLKDPFVDSEDYPREVFLIARKRRPIRSTDMNWFDDLRNFLGPPIEEADIAVVRRPSIIQDIEGQQRQQEQQVASCSLPNGPLSDYVNHAYEDEDTSL